MRGKVKKGLGIGCLVVLAAVLVFAGAATWYAARINRQYKAVQRSEEILRAAVGSDAFTPSSASDLDPVRLDIFLAVRDSLAGVRSELEVAAKTFARERERNRSRGLRGFLSLLGAGSDLAPVYATYWQARNRALAAHRMAPDEYAWLYQVVYHGWLGKDPDEGREIGTPDGGVVREPIGDLSPESLEVLAPRRLRLEAGYSALLNPIELIFSEAE